MFRARNNAGPKHYSLTWSQESCLLHNRPLIVDNRDATFNILVSFRDDTLEGVLEIVSQRIPTDSRLHTNQLAIGQRLVHTAPVIAIVGRTERVCGIQVQWRISVFPLVQNHHVGYSVAACVDGELHTRHLRERAIISRAACSRLGEHRHQLFACDLENAHVVVIGLYGNHATETDDTLVYVRAHSTPFIRPIWQSKMVRKASDIRLPMVVS